jgi:mono/diheme cytochrome c family protein
MKNFLSFIGALAIIIAAATGVYFFGGFYNVAAIQPDPGIVAWALGYVRDASLDRHATDTPPPAITLDDPEIIQAGARIYASQGCTNCHGGPGVKWAKFSEGLRPAAPDLKEKVKDLGAPQIFWIVKNGINMTAMPSFAAAGVSDEDIWKIAAFAKRLPDVTDNDYQAWTAELSR